ncbi:MAG: PAS domain S-box protein [Vicinamibacterales bacterium]
MPDQPVELSVRATGGVSPDPHVDEISAVVLCCTPAGIITQWNREAARVFGAACAEMIGAHYSQVFATSAQSVDAVTSAMDRLRNGLPSWSFEAHTSARDGSNRVVLCVMTQRDEWPDRTPGYVITGHDITERAHAHERLRVQEAALSAAQRLAEIGSWVWDPVSDVVEWSEELFQIFGIDPAGGALTFAEQLTMYRSGRDQLQQAVAHTRATGAPFELDVEIVRPAGEIRWIVARGAVVDQPGPVRLHGTAHDVTERKHAQAALESLNRKLNESQRQYRELVENLTDVVFSMDREGRFQYVSSSVSKYGYTPVELTGQLFSRFVHPDDVAQLIESLDRSAPPGATLREFRVKDATGGVHHVRARTRRLTSGKSAIGLTGVLTDVTEQRFAEEQLQVAQRLEAIGRLAGGVAHDFNNLVIAINGYADFALEKVASDHPMRTDLQEIRRAGQRAAALTSQLLAFGRKQVLSPQVIRLNDVVRGLEIMLRRLVGDDIAVQVNLGDDTAALFADAGQIEQVIVNLIVNARDAMPSGGNLLIATSTGPLPGSVSLDDPANATVALTVSDTGCGMDERTKAHIFEPFFTTKPPGIGTGLGLPMVYGIVTQTGGTIAVQSAVGKGTTFTLTFPREPVPAPPVIAGPAVAAPRTHTVMVVEDEDAVLRLVTRCLASAGYHVLTAPGGEQALQTASACREGIDLLLTDVVMPHMSGRELSDRLVRERPGLKVLFMSGYSGSAIARHGVLESGVHLISKPFTAAELKARVEALLGEG